MVKFSVIIPAYNAAKTIERCIESVHSQTYTNWELFVIDDGSIDNTAEIAKAKILHGEVITKKNEGVSSARNLGMKLASGDYILFLDADDYLPRNALDCYEKTIRTSVMPDVVFGSFFKIYPKRKELCNPVGKKKQYVYNSNKKEFDPFVSRLIGTVWGKCYKKELICNSEFNENLSLCEDADFNFRTIIQAENVIFINSPVYNYVYSINSTIRKYTEENLQKYINAVNTIENENDSEFIRGNVMEFVCTVFSVVCFNLLFTDQNKDKFLNKRKTLLNLVKNSAFGTAINSVDLRSLSLKHRITIFCAKHNLFFCIFILSLANRIVNRMQY